MPDFLFVYHGGKTPQSPEEGAQEMARWNGWFADMGEAVRIPGNPVGKSRTVTASGIEDHGGANPVSGFTVVEARSLDAALAMARACPMVRDGSGSVEVAEIHEP